MKARRRRYQCVLCLSPVLAIAAWGCGPGTFFGGTDSAARNASADALSGGFPDPLGLTVEQKTQAQAIFESMRNDIEPLREQAEADIRNVLTAEQQATWDEIKANHPAPFGGGFGPPPGPFGGRMGRGMGGPFGGGSANAEVDGPHPMMEGECDPATRRQAMLDRLAEELGLTDAQKAQIATIQDNLHTAIEARRQQALDELKAILTADQLAILEAIEANRPR
ncbi:MAG: hypothetical protein HZA51_08910 [Planctomycetes bacterium]|nr:hypothetical protein [Planctomycetota bacterium]